MDNFVTFTHKSGVIKTTNWLPVSNKAQLFAQFCYTNSASNAAFSVDIDKPMLFRETTIHRDFRKGSGHNMFAL